MSDQAVGNHMQMSDEHKAHYLQILVEELSKAQLKYAAEVKRLYPLESRVRWYERPYYKTGAVKGYSVGGVSLIVLEDHKGRAIVHPRAIMAAVEEDRAG